MGTGGTDQVDTGKRVTHRLVCDKPVAWKNLKEQTLLWRCECGYVLGQGREKFLLECPVFGKAG